MTEQVREHTSVVAGSFLSGSSEACLRIAGPEPEDLFTGQWEVSVGDAAVLVGRTGLTLVVVGAPPPGWVALARRRRGVTILFGSGWSSGRVVPLAEPANH